MPPAEFFKQPQFASKYSVFDSAGKPTADAAGEALSKGATKEIEKLLQKQVKEHAKHEEALKKNPAYIEALFNEVASKREEIRQLLAEEEVNLEPTLVTKLKAELPSKPQS